MKNKEINIIGGGCAALSLARLIHKLPNYKFNLFLGDKNKNYNWQSGRQVTSTYTKIKITLFKIVKEIFYFRFLKKHNSELHISLKDLVND